MTEIHTWMQMLVTALKKQFQDRLLFVGLQGSYQRGEATEQSDIDAVVILDGLTEADLSAYRAVLSAMPEHEKACGFVSSRKALLHWPKYEIFQLEQDTEAWYGTLAPLLPAVTEADIRESVRISAAGLYHAVCHSYLYDPPAQAAAQLKAACKSCFFILRLCVYLRKGVYAPTKAALLDELHGDERELLAAGMSWDGPNELHTRAQGGYTALLLGWLERILADMA